MVTRGDAWYNRRKRKVFAMKKVLALLCGLVLLLSLAACGGTTTGESSAVEETDKITEIFKGVIRVVEEEGVYTPLRFTDEELKEYQRQPTIPYSKCTTGVRMDFYTDAAEISFTFDLGTFGNDDNATIPADGFDIFENGEYQATVTASHRSTDNRVSYTRTVTDAESRITILFPTRHEVKISNLSLGNVRPYTDYEHKILFLGDSITQGLYADKPSDGYADQVSRALNADYLNLAVGGEKFRVDALGEEIFFQPDHIVIALGTNDKHQNYALISIERNATAYYEKVAQLYPNVPVTVITPFENQGDDFVESYIKVAEKYGFTAIDGRTLIPPKRENFNPDEVHPNSTGFNLISQNLLPLLKQNMGI